MDEMEEVSEQVWRILLEMERFKSQAGEEYQGAVAFGLGLGGGCRAGQSSCGLDLGDAYQIPEEDAAGVVRVLRAPATCPVGKMRGGAAPDHHGHSPRVEVELRISTYWVVGRFEWCCQNKSASEFEGNC